MACPPQWLLAVLLATTRHALGANDDQKDILGHLLGKQLKEPGDFVSPSSTWSIFNVFGSPAHQSASPLDALLLPEEKRA